MENKWVDVNERLPEKFVSVLGYARHGNGFCMINEWFLTEYGWQCPSFDGEYNSIIVTHWMELPKPPMMDND